MNSSVGAVEQRRRAPPASRWWRSRARRRTRRARGSRSSASANWPSCSRSSSSLPCSRATSNSERAYTLSELVHQLLCASGGQAGEVQFAQRLLDQPALVGVVERLARDLLGGHDRQVGDLAADVVERALGRGLDVALGASWPLRRGSPGRARGPRARATRRSGARAGRSPRTAPGLLQALAVFGEDLVGLAAQSGRRRRSRLRSSSRARRALRRCAGTPTCAG